MAQNVGALDATLRVGLGFGLMFAAFLLAPPWSRIAYAGFLVLAISGFSGQCLAYRLFGISTCGKSETH